MISTYMYMQAFTANKFGYGIAIAVFIIAESILAVFILRKATANSND